MQLLPETDDALLLRTDFSDEAAWQALRQVITEPVDGFRAYVDPISDAIYEALGLEYLIDLARQGPYRSFLLVADELTFTHPERPLLVIDLADEPGRTFRVVPAAVWRVENNLSIANMDFRDFADAVDDDGIFRDFR